MLTEKCINRKKSARAFYMNSVYDLSFHSREDAQPCIDLGGDHWTLEAFMGVQ